MIKTRIIPALMAAVMALPGAAFAAGAETHIEDVAFSFEGPFGTYEKHQLQRGFQVYQEVCSACHGLKYLSFRELGSEIGPAFPTEQVKAIAALYEVADEEGEPGDTRAGRASDKFPANTGADAPDLSLMAKARAGFHGPYGSGLSQLFNGIGGPEYIYSILDGYDEEPECAADAGMEGSYNKAFAPGGYPDECKIFEMRDGNNVEVGRMAPGSWIAMPPPLDEGSVEYAMHGGEEGHAGEAPEASVEQMSEDVSAFLMWAAEPHMTDRKKSGFRNILMLLALTVLLYLSNKALWAKIKRKE
ncbi:MAG TPA: cytochrome c1 [Thermohalobaculum sp.]|nr:cytochrome c1 [Thermohalobaculum sp.]